jgi:hypothetical protein
VTCPSIRCLRCCALAWWSGRGTIATAFGGCRTRPGLRGVDLEAALLSYLEAADAAARIYAFGDAGEYLERALELWSRVNDPVGRSASLEPTC